MLFSLEGLASDLVVRYSSVVMARRLRHPVQLVLPRTNTHGGRRAGAGRPRRERGVSRRRRPEVSPRYPLHVILRLRDDVPVLRTIVRFKHVKAAFRDGCDRFGLRLCDFSLQHAHIHLVVEADDKCALSRGMQGLAVRLAQHINAVCGRAGKVFADRYFARPLRARADVLNTLRYVRYNWQKHQHALGRPVDWREVDRFSTLSGEACWFDEAAQTVARPRTWLLRAATNIGVPAWLLRASPPRRSSI